MSIPILRQGNNLLCVVQSAISDDELLHFKNSLLEQVSRYKAAGVVIDVTVLDVIDSFAARTITSIAQAVRLCGAQIVISGIQPEVAFAMTQLGLTLEGVESVLDSDEALSILGTRSELYE